MKKLKKLVLKKESIVNLSQNEMGGINGGGTFDAYCNTALDGCNDYGASGGLNCAIYSKIMGNCNYGGGGNPSNDCTRPPRCCNYGCCETLYC